MPAGLYIHIPFCRRRCFYCDFSFVTGTLYYKDFTEALLSELDVRANEVPDGKLSSIYFGGGTPSRLSIDHLTQILSKVASLFSWDDGIEITMEVNPEDLTNDFLTFLSGSPINRLSMGVQSFDDTTLKWLGRKHTGKQAHQAIEKALSTGITDYSVDLIYGVPTLTDEQWASQIKQVGQWPVQHLSAYGLSIEEKTPLDVLIKNGKYIEPEDAQSVSHFYILHEEAIKAGFEWYEISNFARAGNVARHNTSYWQGLPYIGVGPSAHSYDGKVLRSKNAHALKDYLQTPCHPTREELTMSELHNEYIMTQLRMRKGLTWSAFAHRFGSEFVEMLKNKSIGLPMRKGLLIDKQGLRLEGEALLWCDSYITLLME